MEKISKLATVVAKAAKVHKKAMIIDEILDRKDGVPYNHKAFYDYVSQWLDTLNAEDIARALDSGTEKDVKRELCRYVKMGGYNEAICNYINSVNWLEEENNGNVIAGKTFPNEAKRLEELLKQNNIEYKTSKKDKNVYFEIFFKGKDVWTVNDILNAVLEDRSAFKLIKRAKHLKQVRKRAGYSNNPDYVGDWFGKGQIDFSAIINPNDSGEVWMVKLWGGSGYILDVYLVKANGFEDAVNKVFEWSYENEGANNIVFDREDLEKEALEYFKDEPDMFDDTNMDEEEFIDRFLEEYYVANEDYSLFAREENFFADKVPEEYLKGNKESSKKSNLNKKANIYGKIDDYLETLNYFERGLYTRGGIWVSFKDNNALNSFKKFLDDLKINYKEYALGNDFYDDDNGDRQTIYIKSEEWRNREADKKTNLTKKATLLDSEVEREKHFYKEEKELKNDLQKIETIIKKIKDNRENATKNAIKHEKIFHKDEVKNENNLELSKFYVKMQDLYLEYLQKVKDMIEK